MARLPSGAAGGSDPVTAAGPRGKGSWGPGGRPVAIDTWIIAEAVGSSKRQNVQHNQPHQLTN
jgi:hypothetical protein